MSKGMRDNPVMSTGRTAAANFAKEKPKKRHKPADPLEYDVQRAMDLGYGVHYGKYKADHPNTREEFETDAPPPMKKAEPNQLEKTCLWCKSKFIVGRYSTNKKYCSDDCRKYAEQARSKGHQLERFCVWCGGPIPRGEHRTKYCSTDCYYAAESDRRNKRKEAKANAEQ